MAFLCKWMGWSLLLHYGCNGSSTTGNVYRMFFDAALSLLSVALSDLSKVIGHVPSDHYAPIIKSRVFVSNVAFPHYLFLITTTFRVCNYLIAYNLQYIKHSFENNFLEITFWKISKILWQSITLHCLHNIKITITFSYNLLRDLELR